MGGDNKIYSAAKIKGERKEKNQHTHTVPTGLRLMRSVVRIFMNDKKNAILPFHLTSEHECVREKMNYKKENLNCVQTTIKRKISVFFLHFISMNFEHIFPRQILFRSN